MPTKNINLTEHYSSFVDDLITGGKYKNASEVMRAALRLLEQQTAEEAHKLKLLRQLAREGFDQLDQGEGIMLQGKDQLTAHIAKLGKKATKELKNGTKH